MKSCDYLNLEYSGSNLNNNSGENNFHRILTHINGKAKDQISKLRTEKTKVKKNQLGEDFAASKILNDEERIKKLEELKLKKNTKETKELEIENSKEPEIEQETKIKKQVAKSGKKKVSKTPAPDKKGNRKRKAESLNQTQPGKDIDEETSLDSLKKLKDR